MLHTFESSLHDNESIESIQKSIDNLKLNETSITDFGIYSLGDNSTLIVSTASENLGKRADPEDLKAAKNDAPVTIIRDDILDVTSPLHVDGKVVYAAGVQFSMADQLNNIHIMLLKIILSGLLSMVFASLFIIFVSNRIISKPLKKLTLASEKIAAGDLNVSFEAELNRKDEVGLLSNSLKSAAENTRVLITEILSNSCDMSEASQELSASVQEIKARIEIINNSTFEINKSVQEASSVSEEISVSVREVNSSLEGLSLKAMEGSDNAV